VVRASQTDIWHGKIARPVRSLTVATLCAALLAASGCAQPTVSRSGVQVPAGQWAEANLLLKQGDRISWDWTTSQVVHFNVHTHQGGTAKEEIAQDAATGHGSFTAPQGGGYSLFWQNDGMQPVTLTYSVQGGQLDSVYPL
jgi:hypothetical protein